MILLAKAMDGIGTPFWPSSLGVSITMHHCTSYMLAACFGNTPMHIEPLLYELTAACLQAAVATSFIHDLTFIGHRPFWRSPLSWKLVKFL